MQADRHILAHFLQVYQTSLMERKISQTDYEWMLVEYCVSSPTLEPGQK